MEVINTKSNEKNLEINIASEVIELIISAEEIVLLKIGDTVLIDKNEQLNSKSKTDEFRENFQFYEQYFHYSSSLENYDFRQMYAFKGNRRALLYNESIDFDNIDVVTKKQVFSAEEGRRIFAKDNYDGLYLIDTKGIILYAYNKVDGLSVNREIIPSKESLILKEDKRKKEVGSKDATNYDSIKNLNIYNTNSMLNNFEHILVISNDGKLKAYWFKLIFLGNDQFELITSDLLLLEPNIDDVISWVKSKEDFKNNRVNPKKREKVLARFHNIFKEKE